MHARILRHLESLGFLTSVHRMGEYCELHAVKLPEAEVVHIARADGDATRTFTWRRASWRGCAGWSWMNKLTVA
jgi:hypothetical protein